MGGANLIDRTAWKTLLEISLTISGASKSTTVAGSSFINILKKDEMHQSNKVQGKIESGNPDLLRTLLRYCHHIAIICKM